MTVESAFCPADAADAKGACEEAAFIRVRHGDICEEGPSALPEGSLITVRELFANVPARLKFLKSPATELKRCQELLSRLALARTDVGFTLSVGSTGNERIVLRLEPGRSLAERVGRIWPAQSVDALVPLSGERGGIRVRGLASLPQCAQAKGDRIWLYVNGRPVSSRLLMQALREAYKGRLTTREHPQAVLFLDIEPQEVDVNVHPAKTEVRFRDERAVFMAVRTVLEQALAGHGPLSGVGVDLPGDDERGWRPSTPPQEQGFLPPLYSGDEGGKPPSFFAGQGTQREQRPTGFWGSIDRPRIMEAPALREPSAEDERPGTDAAGSSGLFDRHYDAGRAVGVAEGIGRTPAALPPHVFSDALPSFEIAESGRPEAERGDVLGQGAEAALHSAETHTGGYPVRVGGLVCLGQVGDTYLIIVKGDALMLLDQHAAHERVLLHGIERQNAGGASQLLALPQELTLHPAESRRLQELFSQLTQLGYALDAAADTVVVKGVPPLLGRQRGLEMLRDILNDRTDGLDDLFHLMACRSAIKAGQCLTGDEAAGLLRRWVETPDCEFCPHGRPTVLSFDMAALEKMFKRKI